MQLSIFKAVKNKILTAQTQNKYCLMRKLLKIWAHHKQLSPQIEMRQMRALVTI
jgi:hypothetical protein